MPDLRPITPPRRAELLRSLAASLERVIPGFRPVATDMLADTSRIDVFGVAEDGKAVLALIGEAGDDLLLVARALAQREWLAPRLPDWRKLAPDLGVVAGAPIQAVVLCPDFGTEASAAVRAVEPGAIQLVRWRYLRNGRDASLLLEPLAKPAEAPEPAPRAVETPAPFRSGLSESDLGLSDEERAEFD